jgi:SAM-dependent methyltransferase
MMFGSGEAFSYVECDVCGTLQIEPIPADLAPYYPSGYYSLQPLKLTAAPKLKAWGRRSRLDAYLAGLDLEALWRPLFGARDFFPWLKALGARRDWRVLDLGAGNGGFLRDLWEHGFTRLEGLDPYLAADIDYPGAFKVRKAGLEAAQGPYDLISLHHVLEHLPDPQAVLRQARALLAPAGRLLIRIPLADSEAREHYGVHWVNWDAPRHLHLLTRRAIQTMAAKAGLKVVRLSFDSSDFQFWGSEQYSRGIALNSPLSFNVNRKASGYRRLDLWRWRRRAAALNRAGRGDSGVFVLAPA